MSARLARCALASADARAAPGRRPTAEDKAKFKKLCQLCYKDQAVWFMNGFWGDGIDGTQANDIWCARARQSDRGVQALVATARRAQELVEGLCRARQARPREEGREGQR